jgi:hypothetical protein
MCYQCTLASTETNWIPPSPVPEILASNTIPSPDQIQAVHESLSTAQTNLSRLDQEINKTEAHLSRLSETRDALQAYTTEHLAVVAPCRRLPPELWAEIFIRCSKGLKRTLAPAVRDTFDPKSGPLLLTHVCSWWRVIAISTPALWTSIRLVLSFPKPYHANLVNMWIERSCTLPLAVAFIEAKPVATYYPSIHWEMNAALNLLVEQSNRWVDAFFMLPPYDFSWQTFRPIRNNLSQLRCLSINTFRGLWPVQMAMNLFEFAPKLSSLALDHAGASVAKFWSLPFLSLTFLEVHQGAESTASFESCFFAMRLMPNLKECLIRCNSSFASWPALPDTTLSQLTFLHITLDQSIFPAPVGLGKMFSALSLPCLSKLELRVKNTLTVKPPWDHKPFVKFLRRSPSLRRLMLDNPSISSVEFEDILRAASSVKHLSIYTDAPDHILVWLVNATKPLLPKLRTIKVVDTSVTPSAFPQSFFPLLSIRGSNYEGPARLKSATLHYPKPVDDQLWNRLQRAGDEFLDIVSQHNLRFRIEQPNDTYDSKLHQGPDSGRISV